MKEYIDYADVFSVMVPPMAMLWFFDGTHLVMPLV